MPSTDSTTPPTDGELKPLPVIDTSKMTPNCAAGFWFNRLLAGCRRRELSTIEDAADKLNALGYSALGYSFKGGLRRDGRILKLNLLFATLLANCNPNDAGPVDIHEDAESIAERATKVREMCQRLTALGVPVNAEPAWLMHNEECSLDRAAAGS